jgi:hypothetical protein
MIIEFGYYKILDGLTQGMNLDGYRRIDGSTFPTHFIDCRRSYSSHDSAFP